jgi:hypothetical protein
MDEEQKSRTKPSEVRNHVFVFFPGLSGSWPLIGRADLQLGTCSTRLQDCDIQGLLAARIALRYVQRHSGSSLDLRSIALFFEDLARTAVAIRFRRVAPGFRSLLYM